MVWGATLASRPKGQQPRANGRGAPQRGARMPSTSSSAAISQIGLLSSMSTIDEMAAVYRNVGEFEACEDVPIHIEGDGSLISLLRALVQM